MVQKELKILFLGYNSKETKIYSILKKKYKDKIKIKNLKRKISLKDVDNCDLVIAFGYRKIIDPNIIKKAKVQMVNLHMSYLPYNRGAFPNFWSWIKKTPKGVTIHLINKELDKGPILIRKKVKLNAKKRNFLFKL